jgi:hypothetical protein
MGTRMTQMTRIFADFYNRLFAGIFVTPYVGGWTGGFNGKGAKNAKDAKSARFGSALGWVS